MPDFIDPLPLSGADKTALRALGASSPAELLALIEAAGPAASDLLGSATAQELSRCLGALAGPTIGAQAAPVCSLGALGGPPPVLEAPRYDLAERDRLFAELQLSRARAAGAGDAALLAQIARLEADIESMLSL